MIRVSTRNDFLPVYMVRQNNNYRTWALSLQLPSETPGCLASSLTQNVICTSVSLFDSKFSSTWGL